MVVLLWEMTTSLKSMSTLTVDLLRQYQRLVTDVTLFASLPREHQDPEQLFKRLKELGYASQLGENDLPLRQFLPFTKWQEVTRHQYKPDPLLDIQEVVGMVKHWMCAVLTHGVLVHLERNSGPLWLNERGLELAKDMRELQEDVENEIRRLHERVLLEIASSSRSGHHALLISTFTELYDTCIEAKLAWIRSEVRGTGAAA